MNDKILCKIAAKAITERHNDTFDVLEIPDDIDRTNPAVDMLCAGKEHDYPIEHTLIESFPDQIYDNVRFVECFAPLEGILAGKLPKPGHYHFSIEVGEASEIKDPEKTREIVANWIERVAPKLVIYSPGGERNHYIKERLPELEFELKLYKEKGHESKDGSLLIMRSISEEFNLDSMRCERIDTALERKCPKLKEARGEKCESILCLEYNDNGLGDNIAIADCIVKGLSKRDGDVPDHIVLVDTGTEPYYVHFIKDRELMFPEMYNEFVIIHPHDV